jgi:hypothetical protein
MVRAIALALSSPFVPDSPSTTCHPAAYRSLVEERSQLQAALAAATVPPASDAAAAAQ